MKIRHLKAALIAGFAGLAMGADALPAPDAEPVFKVSVNWSGARAPNKVWIEQAGMKDLELKPQGDVFKGEAPAIGAQATKRAYLVALYGNERLTLPVRFTPTVRDMNLIVHAASASSCRDAVVLPLEHVSSVFSERMAAYFTAKKLATTPKACGQRNQARVVRVWSDLSAELAEEYAAIAVDTDALEALKKIPRHLQYATATERRMRTWAAAADYRASLALAADGDFFGAMAINQQVAQRLAADPVFAADVLEFRHVNLERLELDHSYFETRAAEAARG